MFNGLTSSSDHFNRRFSQRTGLEKDTWIGVKYALDEVSDELVKRPANYEVINGANDSFFKVSNSRLPWRDDHQVVILSENGKEEEFAI